MWGIVIVEWGRRVGDKGVRYRRDSGGFIDLCGWGRGKGNNGSLGRDMGGGDKGREEGWFLEGVWMIWMWGG